MLHNFLPETSEKLRGQKKKIIAAFSLACVGAFFVFLPALIADIATPLGVSLIAVAFAVMLFFASALSIVATLLGIRESIFNDYVKYPSSVHWSIIGIALTSIMFLAGSKVFFSLKKEKIIQ